MLEGCAGHATTFSWLSVLVSLSSSGGPYEICSLAGGAVKATPGLPWPCTAGCTEEEQGIPRCEAGPYCIGWMGLVAALCKTLALFDSSPFQFSALCF